MSARSFAETVRRLAGPLNRITSCVTRVPLQGGFPSNDPSGIYVLAFASPTLDVQLRGARQFRLVVMHYATVRRVPENLRRWEAIMVGYAYRILRPDGRELLAFHWHPEGQSPVTSPHLHVRMRDDTVDLANVHVPTGHVSLATVVRFVITELGVEPLRADWREILTAADPAMAIAGIERTPDR